MSIKYPDFIWKQVNVSCENTSVLFIKLENYEIRKINFDIVNV